MAIRQLLKTSQMHFPLKKAIIATGVLSKCIFLFYVAISIVYYNAHDFVVWLVGIFLTATAIGILMRFKLCYLVGKFLSALFAIGAVLIGFNPFLYGDAVRAGTPYLPFLLKCVAVSATNIFFFYCMEECLKRMRKPEDGPDKES